MTTNQPFLGNNDKKKDTDRRYNVKPKFMYTNENSTIVMSSHSLFTKPASTVVQSTSNPPTTMILFASVPYCIYTACFFSATCRQREKRIDAFAPDGRPVAHNPSSLRLVVGVSRKDE